MSIKKILVAVIILHHYSKKAGNLTTKQISAMAIHRSRDFVSKKKTRRKTADTRAKKAPQNSKSSPNKKNKSIKGGLISELKKLNIMDMDTIDALPHTKKHEAHILKVTNSFINVLSADENKIWENLLKLKAYKLSSGKKVMVPTLFVDMGGYRTPEKTQIVNKAIVYWMRHLKKTKITKRDKFTFYQPVTQNQMLRTFIGHMSKSYFWAFDIEDFDFAGGVNAELKAMYEKRYKLYGKVSTIIKKNTDNDNLHFLFF